MNSLVVSLLARSIANRRFSLSLIALALAAAVALYISVQNIQRMTRGSFENTIAGVDLVVAARGSDIQVLLNTVFGVGASTSLMSAESTNAIAAMPETAWHAPVSLGDSHKGYRVIGTSNEMFRHVLSARDKGFKFDGVLQVALGADVAINLSLAEGDSMVLQHGVGDYGAAHDDLPFAIARVLGRTGTPFDRAIFIPLQASEAIHRGWRGGQRLMSLTPEQVETHEDKGDEHDAHDDEADEHDAHAHGPSGIDAVFVGLRDKRTVIRMQRRIADYQAENLMAVIPGVTLSRIWQIIGLVDRGFLAINLLIIGLVLLSMVAMTVLNADNRRREMAILRALGAAPRTLVGLMLAEAFFLSVVAVLLGIGFSIGLSLAAQDILAARFGLTASGSFNATDASLAFYLVPAALLANIVPAVRLYRHSVNDGIMVKR